VRAAEVFASIESLGVVPVVEIDDAADAVMLARTLVDAGLPVIEMTLRTPAGLKAVELIAAECPECLLGAGTLLTVEMVNAAADAGASFGVSPGVNVACLEAAQSRGLPFIPGSVTPSEVLAALDAGVSHVKFFPAAAYGGPTTVSALAAPLASTGVRFMPTGGIKDTTAASYLCLPAVFAVGGSWIASRADIAAGRWDAISARARAVAGIRESVLAQGIQ
jgi:2-dehydro-3-deoxyphosphogluconate aldolase/(4S)-4-hydroxy-2-oxoglutarate aldolase